MADDSVSVPVAEVRRLLGMPADSTEAAVRAELDKVLAAPAMRQNTQADGAAVAAAIADGRITEGRAAFWMNALLEDPKGARAVLASLAPGVPAAALPRPESDGERVEREVLARLGLKPSPKPVKAAGPQPVRMPPGAPSGSIRGGGNPADSTRQETDDAHMWALGQRFRGGLEPPKSQGFTYVDDFSPNTPTYVRHSDGGGHWEPPTGRVIN